MTAEAQRNATPLRIMEDLWASWRTQALVAGIELGVFTHIAEGSRTPKDIARAAQASERGIERLLNALVGIAYLTKKGDRYELEPIAREFLVRGKDAYRGDAAQTVRLVWESWAQLTDVVRTGRPMESVDAEQRGREFFPKLVGALFPGSFAAARAAALALPAKTRRRIKAILDVAAGSGAWSIPFAQAFPDVRVTALDFPEVTAITKQFTERFGVADRYDYLEGNLREVDFGRERYDLVILGHIIHSEGAERGQKLVQKSHQALKDGGLLLIAEIIPNDTRTGPTLPLLFGLNMLLRTEHGDVFTMREYRTWLKNTGFTKITSVPVPAPSPLILATK